MMPDARSSQVAPPVLLAIAFVAFISLGLPDGLLGVSWPSLRGDFERPLPDIGWLLGAAMAGYLVASFFGGALLHALGVGWLLAASSFLVAYALWIYALTQSWPMLVVSAVIGGLGAGAIDAGVNVVAARRFSPRVVNWLHGCWGIGASAGAGAMTLAVTSEAGWRAGYAVAGAALAALTVMFLLTRGHWVEPPQHDSAPSDPDATIGRALTRPVVLVHVLFFFVYGGVESVAGQWLFSLLDARGVEAATAGGLVAGFWMALTLGRFAFGQMAAGAEAPLVLRGGFLLAVIGGALLLWPESLTAAVSGALLLGFGLAPMFPTMVSMTPERVGSSHASHAMGFQVAAAAGGIAVFPGAIGYVAGGTGLEIVPPALLGGLTILFALDRLAATRTPPREIASPG